VKSKHLLAQNNLSCFRLPLLIFLCTCGTKLGRCYFAPYLQTTPRITRSRRSLQHSTAVLGTALNCSTDYRTCSCLQPSAPALTAASATAKGYGTCSTDYRTCSCLQPSTPALPTASATAKDYGTLYSAPRRNRTAAIHRLPEPFNPHRTTTTPP
jgi:hypothetical protein